MTYKKENPPLLCKPQKLPSACRVVRAKITWIAGVANISRSTSMSIEAAPIGWGRRIYGNQMSELYCNHNQQRHASECGYESAKCHVGNWQLHHDRRDVREEQTGDVCPHNDSVHGAASPRFDKQGECREHHCRYHSGESREYVIHDGRPRTQLFLTLRLIWRSGKLIRNNKIDRPLRRSARADRPPRSVSLACVAALTGALLLLAGCAGAHDGCGAPYAFSEKSGFVGRPA